jgi:formylglycine-generating enzyme required for sulfatase activity
MHTSRETPKPFEVDAFPDGATPTGVFDLWGNIFEWTSAVRNAHNVFGAIFFLETDHQFFI